ncbi:hypothetical protein KDN24_15700 [Bacillus sp. Bva_UNVM-123]|uniref:hypothetical protein n=1 Tax=Bacillus sp. Bva_UNVM-123 TaxID=2829798 RepID=UPI00391F0A4B
MTYIIENANILKGKQLNTASLLVDNGRISAMKQSFQKYKFMKMNAEPFIMTPTPTLFKKHLPIEKSFSEFKKYFMDEFILKGSTAFLTVAHISQEHELTTKIKRLKTQLFNCPIDYIIGVQIPVRLVTQTFLRKCKREKVPAIFIEIEQMDELYQLPWGWIREAMFPYNSPLIPVFKANNMKEQKQVHHDWICLMEEERIPFIKHELTEDAPLSNHALAKIGIFPFKSNIQQGHELSYNLYESSDEIRNIEELELFHYHNSKLVVTVHKGEVIRANDFVFFRPGFGEHVKINTPSYLKIEA